MRSALAVAGAVLLAVAVYAAPVWMSLAGAQRFVVVGASFLVCAGLVIWAFSDRSQ
jgi:hypothetical protein